MSKKKSFSLPAIAATLGSILAGKVGASVKFADVPTAMTDGTTVYLSSRLKTGATEDEAHILRGFLAHEILGHVRNTNFKKMVEWRTKRNSPLASSIENIIEDGRIERAAWSIFPKVRSILHKCVDALVREGKVFQPLDENDPPEAVITALLLLHVRKDLGQNLDPTQVEALAFPMFGEELCRKMVEIAIRGAHSPAGKEGFVGVLEAADEILALLDQAGQGQAGQGQQGQDQAGQGQQGQDQAGQGQAGQGQQGQDQAGQGQQGQDQAGQGQAGQGQAGQGQAGQGQQGQDQAGQGQQRQDQAGQGQQGQDQAGQGQQGQDQAGQGQELSQAQIDAVKAALGGAHPGVSDLGGAMISILTDVITHDQRTTEMGVMKINPKNGGLPDLNAKAAANKLGAKLERLLEDRTNHRDIYGEDGRLCGRRLVSAMSGEQRVFRRATGENTGLDVAVSLMIDCSGSMRGPDIQLAKAAGYAVSEALSKYDSQGVALEVLGFNDAIFRIKNFEESFPSRSKCFKALNANGGTRFQQTLLQCVKKLSTRKEARKIVLFITDGDLGTDPAAAVDTLAVEGVEVRGVLVGAENDAFFVNANIKHFGMAKDASGIPAAVFKAMERDFF